MIKGITLVHAVAPGASDTFEHLSSLFSAIGFELGKGWQDANGQGAAFLAPVANFELVTGLAPATPTLLVEVTQLDHIRAFVETWLLDRYPTEELSTRLSLAELTHWNSRLFSAQLTDDLTLGFWQSEDVLHGKPVAIEGDLSAADMRFGIVTTRWNTVITDRLLQGALDGLYRSGSSKENVQIVRVPGAWEIPNAARTLADSGEYDAIITLGCLIRGETAHYEAIYNEVTRGIGQSQQESGIPHTFGVLTCETLEQALDRAGIKAGNKGFEAAIAAIEMVSIQRKLTKLRKIPTSSSSHDDFDDFNFEKAAE
jgi:6,7-dimethyl-8-ribityllumazine synthase